MVLHGSKKKFKWHFLTKKCQTLGSYWGIMEQVMRMGTIGGCSESKCVPSIWCPNFKNNPKRNLIDIRLGKLVILGYLFDVLEECIIIAAGLCNKSIFAFPFEKKLKAYANKLVWSNQSFSDCLAVLNAYSVWKDKVQTGYFERRYNEEQEWCNQRYKIYWNDIIYIFFHFKSLY